MLECTCWSIHVRAYMLEHTCWSIHVGAYMVVIIIFYISRRMAVLQISRYEVGQICWCVHVCYPGCRDHCVHVHHLLHCERNQESHQTKEKILLCEYSVHSSLFIYDHLK